MTTEPLLYYRLNQGDHDLVLRLTRSESRAWADHLYRVELAKSGDLDPEAVDAQAVRLFWDPDTVELVGHAEDGRPIMEARGYIESAENPDA